jgi:hypothetical protein
MLAAHGIGGVVVHLAALMHWSKLGSRSPAHYVARASEAGRRSDRGQRVIQVASSS